ncbi:hypothetical protein [Mesohalobacter halotolerans]|uniref:Uncharacterized protein n=1 Tax=Mesohalobacter halotolerans TaxID=1883405 RepID=A0A4U5TPI8_9FLAO|nr:hypothetical protein [Mesohalobacter halotolerans]MBS3738160.1 hypothetical protein [Psychroflexus sp.]TKS55621.1 hypothetical protein FCN74_09930 [Mesohalobacter halotolerans]
MKTIKFIQSGLVLSFLFIFNLSLAQVQYEKTNSADAMAERMTKYEVQQLNLDAKEAESLGQINLLYAQQMVAIRKQNASNNNKTEIEALKRSHNQKIRSLLSSEKFQKYLALKEDEDKKTPEK